MYVYKESVDSTHVLINFNASTHDMTGKEWVHGNQIVSTITLIPWFTNNKTLWFYNLRSWIIMTSSLLLCLLGFPGIIQRWGLDSWNTNAVRIFVHLIDVFASLIYFYFTYWTHFDAFFLPVPLITPCSNPYVCSAWNFDLVLFLLTFWMYVMTGLSEISAVPNIFMPIPGS